MALAWHEAAAEVAAIAIVKEASVGLGVIFNNSSTNLE